MSLESTLERIAVAVEAIAKLGGAEITRAGPGRPAKADKSPDLKVVENTTAAVEQPVVATGPTREAMQKLVTDTITAGHRVAVIAALGKHGGKNVSTVKPELYGALQDDLNKIVADAALAG